MSIAAAQSSQFVPQAQASQSVFTFTNAGNYIVFRVRDFETIPFWSSSSRLKTVAKLHPKYRDYTQEELPLDRFLAWLPRLEADKIQIGVNWSGKRLTGFNCSAADILARFHAAQPLPPLA